ncbi:hypothetical protein CANINC_004936 [Pichia inconspicua]|uniref:FAD dependent oxidoreductase domain-containing protein n=1 Tax=Pichia inconspicua TaxID=52247 RepID=A0A4T0WUP8_9ASCO|nr:hypothetical protein CANINC_004936 [[Candida] inconspicua]
MPSPEYSKDSKIIVVGSGVFGLSTAYNLIKAGYKNIEIFDRTNYDTEKYSPLKQSDSASGDINKFFRVYYEDKSLYSKLAIEALDIWNSWNSEIQNLSDEDKARFIDDDLELIRQSCGLRINDTKDTVPVELKNLEGFTELGLRDTQYNLTSERDLLRAKLTGLDRKLEVIRDLKARGKVTTVSGTLDSIGRMLKADKACFYVKILLENEGVIFHYGDEGTFVSPIYCPKSATTVKGIRTKDGKEHKADLVVVSAGPWSTSLVLQLQHRTQASLANIVYLEIPKTRQDLIDKYSEYPHIQWKTTTSEFDRNEGKFAGEGGFAFFPNTKKEGILKVNTRQTKYLNPVKVGDDYISVPKTLGDEKLPKSVIQEAKDILMTLCPDVVTLPGVKVQSKLIWYTDSINSDFIIDFVPGYENLIVATGGSAHGFKFLPVLGKTVVSRLKGEETSYTKLFKWKNEEDIIVDNYGLKDKDINADERRNFNNAVFVDETDLVFNENDLSRLETVTLV